MTKYKILLVDDEAFFFELISELLGEQYQFEYLECGEECLAKAELIKPDLILMDVQMPGLNGYETCSQLKQSEATKDIPVFFVSANDCIEEKVKGYDAGGHEYIVKPLDGPEIDRKIKLFLDQASELERQKQALAYATSAAHTALSSQGELGVVISYLTNSFLCLDLDSIANQLLASLKEFGYYAVVRMSSNLATVTRNSDFKWNPIEDSIFDQLHSEQRIEEHSEWIIFRSDRVQIILKADSQDNDEDRKGRVKDHVSFLIQGAEARIHNLNVEQGLDEQTSTLFSIIKSTHRKLANFNAQKVAARRSIVDSIDTFYREFENNLAKISLTENQEKEVLAATDGLVDSMIDICADKLNDHMVLNSLLADLKRMVDDVS
ncbi:MAG: response regulator [Pseudomonadales bacterium]|nr:response regulator [Pseudomonadales bacterium]